MITSHIKSWLKVNLVLLIVYIIYDYVRFSMTGISDPFAVQVGLYTAAAINFIVPALVIRAIYKTAAKVVTKLSVAQK